MLSYLNWAPICLQYTCISKQTLMIKCDLPVLNLNLSSIFISKDQKRLEIFRSNTLLIQKQNGLLEIENNFHTHGNTFLINMIPNISCKCISIPLSIGVSCVWIWRLPVTSEQYPVKVGSRKLYFRSLSFNYIPFIDKQH